jgi:hypothetical protein
MNMEMNLQSSQEHATTLAFAYSGLVAENCSIFRPGRIQEGESDSPSVLATKLRQQVVGAIIPRAISISVIL